ncbi:hypothetical protein AcV5_009322 [Taiwanofungus camphoratus]|nr:hypothetical protein AcV5_009322 [Antrodia cinnamomea]
MWLSTSYRSIVQSKQAQRKESLSIALTAVTDSDLQHDYLHATASEIVGHIEKDEWTASEILEAYIARAILAQETTNCLTEILFKQAREDAKALDEEFANTNQLRGPLHGVPVSFKDIYDMKGYDSTLGYTLYANRPRQVDAHLVQLIRKAGGIPFVKTNVSQTMFFFECSNPLWGRTLSPHNAQFSPGGSSGGEAALLAMDGSALGWGSDIGGSVRIPASYCGLYSLKPSGMRINKSGITGCLPGFDGVSDVLGPMGRSVNDVELACRVVFGQQGPDYGSAPLPYREVKIPDKLRFGYYISDRFVKASPACQRAVLETVGALRRVGHECVEVEVPEHSKPLELFVGLASADGYETLLSPVGSDPMDSGLLLVVLGPKLFGWIRSLVSWFTRTWFGDYIFSRVLLRSRKKTVREYWKTVVERDEYTRLFYEKVSGTFRQCGRERLVEYNHLNS